MRCPKFSEETMDMIYSLAHKKGIEAAENCDLQMISVQGFVGSFPICGFAWVIIKPGTSRFAKYLINKNIATKGSYYGGVSIWVSGFGQSYNKKVAYANAFANVLADQFGIMAVAMSRLD